MMFCLLQFEKETELQDAKRQSDLRIADLESELMLIKDERKTLQSTLQAAQVCLTLFSKPAPTLADLGFAVFMMFWLTQFEREVELREAKRQGDACIATLESELRLIKDENAVLQCALETAQVCDALGSPRIRYIGCCSC
jgi:hypothetical protein